MSQQPTIVDRAEQPYVAIPVTAPMKEWGRVNALVPEIFTWVSRHGATLAGALFYRYWVIGDMDHEFRVEVGVPLARPAAGDDRVVAGTIPGGRYATLVHHGHPDQLIHSITALDAWASENTMEWNTTVQHGQEIWGARFEFYLTDPKVEPDMSKWSVELAYQLK